MNSKPKLICPINGRRCKRNCALAMLFEHNTEEWICSLSAINPSYTINPTENTQKFLPQVSKVMHDA